MSRLDMDAYRAFTDRPAGETAHPIVVIGAGLAGAISARILADHGFDVVVLDKGRRVGGRCSRRRIDDVTLTHGASQLDHWPSWMTSWADVELEHQRVTPSNNGHRLLDGPETIANWLEGIDVMGKAKEINGIIIYGAIGVGGLKMKIHKAGIRELFTSNSKVMETEALYELGRGLVK